MFALGADCHSCNVICPQLQVLFKEAVENKNTAVPAG
uniref:Uncharacterized protein n=1 Tax=Arundo donax TaxID=35708 RepID=A0A0A9DSE4_ARUDO